MLSQKSGKFIDLFAGCGGLSLGLMKAGWKGLFAIEKNQQAFQTLSHNLFGRLNKVAFSWPEWLPMQPHEISSFIKGYENNLRTLRGQVDLIAGGPPCQGFSFAGKRNHDDPRNRLFKDYAKVVELVRPKYLLLENVAGISVEHSASVNKRKKRTQIPFSERLISKLSDLGYTVYPMLLRASSVGVPQLRPRMIFFGFRNDLLNGLTSEELADTVEETRLRFLVNLGLPTNRPVSVKEAISDLRVRGKQLQPCPDTQNGSQIVYEGPKTAFQRLMHPAHLGLSIDSARLPNHSPRIKDRYTGIIRSCRRGVALSPVEKKQFRIKKQCLVVLDPNRPSHTLTTLPDDIIHFAEPRILTVREYARLQSFPDSFEFIGRYVAGGRDRQTRFSRYTQIGNAVPPFLGQVCGAVLAKLSSKKVIQRVSAKRTQERSTRISLI